MDKNNRRQFLKSSAQMGISCAALLMWHQHAWADSEKSPEKKIIDLKKRSYCGIACEESCELYKATQSNSIELKKKVYEKWHWKEKFNVDFDPDKVVCYTCKPTNGKYKLGMQECEVRICAMENKMESCIQCENLKSCDKTFWTQWGKWYDRVKVLQEDYAMQNGAVMKEIQKK